MNFLNRIKEFFLWLILTNHCRYCNKLIEKGETLCKDCKENLPRITGERCKFCGAGKDRCNCRKKRMNFDGITAPFYYEKEIQESLKLLKFNGKSHLAVQLAEDMAECICEDFNEINFDFITYVPFSRMQKLERSYNQSELLAEEIGKILKLPVKNILFKLFESGTQHDMSTGRRKGNVHGIYDVKNNADVKGKTILLIDDIATTGETLSNCAIILKIRGAEKVYCAAVALTAKKAKKVVQSVNT